MSEATYRQAITQALADELEADQTVFVLGEDVGAAGGVFKTTDGLFERFGAERVLDTPISEQAIIGTAIGAAISGLRPVAEIMFADFAGVCFDQIANQLAKYRYYDRRPVQRAGDDPDGQRRRRRVRRPALAVGRELVSERTRAEDLRARHAVRRLRAAAGGDPRRRPCALLRAQGACST